jgi:NADH-quinone oxidoreductase subunit C
MSDQLAALRDHVVTGLGATALDATIAYDELTVTVPADEIVRAIRFLRDDPECLFVSFIDLCGADYPGREKRFDVVYHLLSPRHNQRIRIKTQTDEVTTVPSIIHVFPSANWFEREAYDLYGILFPAIPTCAVSSRITASRGTRCARISR